VFGVLEGHRLHLFRAADVIDQVVVSDAIQPGRERDFSELEAAQVLQRFHEYLFRKILSRLGATVQVIREIAVDLWAVQLVQLAESCPIVGLRALN